MLSRTAEPEGVAVKAWVLLKTIMKTPFGCLGVLCLVVVLNYYVFTSEEERQQFEQEMEAERIREEEEERRATREKRLEEDLMSAWAMCQEFTEERLVSPSSANWPWDNRPYTSHLGGKRYQVQTHVDSQNRFGAMLRTPVDCVVQKKGTSWTLESLSME